MLPRLSTRCTVPDDVLCRLLRHHVAKERRREVSVCRRAARKLVKRLVVLLPYIDRQVDRCVDVRLPEDAVEKLHFEDVWVCATLRLLLVSATAEENETLLEKYFEVAPPRALPQYVAKRLQQRQEAGARVEHHLPLRLRRLRGRPEVSVEESDRQCRQLRAVCTRHLGWDGMGWGGSGWDGMGWDGVGMGEDGMGLGWGWGGAGAGMEWSGVWWGGVGGWDGMGGWDGVGVGWGVLTVLTILTILTSRSQIPR